MDRAFNKAGLCSKLLDLLLTVYHLKRPLKLSALFTLRLASATLSASTLKHLPVSRFEYCFFIMFEKYTYDNCPRTRSGDIRLLSVQKGSSDDPIECTLTTRPLESPKFANPVTVQKKLVRYEAHSYHWGLLTKMVDIKIYGVSWS